MKTIYPLKTQCIKSKGQKQRPYFYLSAALAEMTGLKKGELVEWLLIDRSKMQLSKSIRKKSGDNSLIFTLKLQAIRTKDQKTRLYVFVPVPLAAAIRLRHGEPVRWEYDGDDLFIVRES